MTENNIGIVAIVLGVLVLIWGLIIWRLSISISRNINYILELKKELDYNEAINNSFYLSWTNRLKFFTVLYVKPFEFIAEYRYTRINDFLVYEEVINDDKTKVAKFHIRSKPQSKLRDVMTLPQLEKCFVESCCDLLKNQKVDAVECISHNRLLSDTIIQKKLTPALSALDLSLSATGVKESFLTWIYCDCLLANNLNWFRTKQGYDMFKKINGATKIVITPHL